MPQLPPVDRNLPFKVKEENWARTRAAQIRGGEMAKIRQQQKLLLLDKLCIIFCFSISEQASKQEVEDQKDDEETQEAEEKIWKREQQQQHLCSFCFFFSRLMLKS